MVFDLDEAPASPVQSPRCGPGTVWSRCDAAEKRRTTVQREGFRSTSTSAAIATAERQRSADLGYSLVRSQLEGQHWEPRACSEFKHCQGERKLVLKRVRLPAPGKGQDCPAELVSGWVGCVFPSFNTRGPERPGHGTGCHCAARCCGSGSRHPRISS